MIDVDRNYPLVSEGIRNIYNNGPQGNKIEHRRLRVYGNQSNTPAVMQQIRDAKTLSGNVL